MTERTKIIFIHGASSSGKSTLARAVRAEINQLFWRVSIDHMRDSGMPMERFRRGDFRWKDQRSAFFEGFHRSLVAYASSGNNLLLEHILEDPEWVSDLALGFQPFDVFFVGLHCDLDELVRWETARGDRKPGSAADDFHRIHKGQRYDLQLDASQPVTDNAAHLISAWTSRRGPSVFERLALEARETAAQ